MKLTSAQEAVITSLRKRNGGIVRPRDVVEEARNPKCPLHALFEWNDRIAAERAREDRAREIIVSISYEPRDPIGLSVSINVPAYIRDPSAPAREQGYAYVLDLRDDPDRAHQALVGEFIRVAALLTRARGLAEVLRFESEVDSLIEQVTTLRTRFEHRPPSQSQ